LIIDSTFVEYVENYVQISKEVTIQDEYIKVVKTFPFFLAILIILDCEP